MDMKYDEWNNSFERGENNILYPQPEVVRFLNRFIKKKINYKGDFNNVLQADEDNNRFKGLDFACGVGRHAILFEEFDIDGYGVDISSVAIKKAKENAKLFGFKKLADRFLVLENSTLPYKENYFNFSVAESCLDSMTFEIARDYFNELIRVSSSYIYISLISSDKNNPVGESTIETKHEEGTIQYFYHEDRIAELIKGSNCDTVYLKKISEISEYDNSSESRFYCIFKKK